MRNNLWSEPPNLDRVQIIRRDIELARRVASDAADCCKPIHSKIERFRSDLSEIQTHLSDRPDDWRLIRSLLVVDMPTIVEALEGAATLPEGEPKQDLLRHIPAVMARATDASQKLSQIKAENLSLGLQVISGRVDEPASGDGDGGVFGRVKRLTIGAGRAISETAERSTQTAGMAMSAVGSAASLTGEHLVSVAGAAGRRITRPVSMRMQAMANATGDVSFTALVLGGLTSAVFPVLTPFVVGEAFLRWPENYTSYLAQLSDEEARIELERSGESSERISEIIATLRGGVIRFDTDCLSITIEPGTGSASGIILRGQLMGHFIEDLSHDQIQRLCETAPDLDTKRALEAWLARQA